MTSSLLLTAIVNLLNKKGLKYLKKCRETLFNSYALLFEAEGGEIWIIADLDLDLLLPVRRGYPLKPSRGFILDLKRRIEGSRVEGVSQPDLERILTFHLRSKGEALHLYIELFSRGNIILTDSGDRILSCKHGLKVRHREIRSGSIYQLPPPRGAPPDQVEEEEIWKRFSSSDLGLAPFLIRNLSLDRYTVNILLERMGISKDISGDEVGEELFYSILNRLKEITEEVRRGEIHPVILYEEGKPSTLLPFDPGGDENLERFTDLIEACERFLEIFLLPMKEEAIKEEGKKPSEERQRLLSNLEGKRIELKERAEETRRIADYLSTKMDILENLFKELEDILRRGSPEASLGRSFGPFTIAQIDGGKRRVTLSLEDGRRITLDFSLNPFQALGEIYTRAKRMERGIESLEERIEELRRELEAEEEGEEAEGVGILKPLRRKRWYERYKWTISSDGLLIIGGRDAATNEALIKRHCEAQDIVFHADIPGSPFVVVKGAGKDPPETTLREAAIFTGAHSRAWRMGLGAIDVYWVRPHQLSKEAPSGEALKRGSFMIYGKRNYIRGVELELGVGLVKMDGEPIIFTGPVSTVKRRTERYIVVRPGRKGKGEFVKEAVAFLLKGMELGKAERIHLTRYLTQDLIQNLPPGGVTAKLGEKN